MKRLPTKPQNQPPTPTPTEGARRSSPRPSSTKPHPHQLPSKKLASPPANVVNS
jgi:hypothetical protein